MSTLMAKSVRINNYKIVVITIALLSAGISWNISEYFLGFELLRPFILWIVVSDEYKRVVDRILSTVKWWSLYVGALLGYLVYRLFVFDTKRTEVDPSHFLSEIRGDPVTEVVQRLNFVIPDYSSINARLFRIDNDGYLIISHSYDQDIDLIIDTESLIIDYEIVIGIDDKTSSFNGEKIYDSFFLKSLVLLFNHFTSALLLSIESYGIGLFFSLIDSFLTEPIV